jgi:hypothetical protein
MVMGLAVEIRTAGEAGKGLQRLPRTGTLNTTVDRNPFGFTI